MVASNHLDSIREVRKHTLEIQARAEKATPGPWHRDYQREVWISSPRHAVAYACKGGGGRDTEQQLNAVFIAASRSDIPWLCEQLLEALSREEALRSLRRNELKIVSSKEPLIVADSLGRNPDGAVRLLPDPSKPWLPLVEE